ncbi:conserved oligomeric Golgi complex subunit 2 [Drosophila mojavensis]|uniref:Conserved oligomeric Golgi complex subunit 2 n=1 Tax=Drosophila mojavensis TaxID=7230 RepID=B4KAP9_DROMO|nr:conserved oligomeric Golgi complex subunit 2 [Drosophila mojavensis]EDW16786.1 uncharacterized protein Dmoj_GI10726 [Drosophila mojavensis]
MNEPARRPSVAGGTSTAEKLCFDKNEFMKENFSVDEFLHKNRNAPSLEQLRDNLGLYLKGLRAAMIDLINEDYADFVNLSANLVGLDQTIDTIQRPLEQFRTEIEGIHSLIEENVVELRSQLEEKRKLREFQRSLQSLKKVYEIMEKLQELIANKLSEDEPAQAVDLERAALDLIQLRFHEKHCDTQLSNLHRSTIQQLEEQVHQELRRFLYTSLQQAKNGASEHLERCLRIYITLDACDRAERAFREDIVAPYMSAIIGEQQLQNSPQGLAGIYSKVLNFISLHMADLLRLTLYSDKLNGFNFVVNSFWADVEMRLELHMNSIFAPGNSEVFYVKYKCTRDFLAKIEELLTSRGEKVVSSFRHHNQTKSFEARWNLPVYFQICFQEIAGKFEAQLEPLLKDDSLQAHPEGDAYHLMPFNGAKEALTRCWSEGVYLSEVFAKFYKLNVQIVLRLSRWIRDVIKEAKSSSYSKPYTRNQLLIALYTDTRQLESYLPQLQQLIMQSAPETKNLALFNNVLGKSIADLVDTLGMHLTNIQDTLKQLLITECGADNVRQVNDLPRLYRKTNREVPTRCSSYVEQMLRPLKAFAAQHEKQLGTLVVEQILAEVCSNITKAYFNVVSEVLTSVQKTEESLRRLRNLKSGGASNSQGSGSASTAVSDDDKIRLQLRVDVAAWTLELGKLNFKPKQIDKLVELSNMVEESIKSKESA